MRSDFVVVACVRLQNLAQMGLAQDNDVVQALTPNRSDQPFGKAILLGRGWCGRLVPDAHGTQSARDNTALYLGLTRYISSGPYLAPGRNVVRNNLVAFNLVGPAAECHRLEQLNPFGIRQIGGGGSLAVGPDKVNVECPPRVKMTWPVGSSPKLF
jgi:hypothetical protein